MGICKQIELEKRRIDKIIKTIQSHSDLYPEGKLRCSKGNNHDQYFINGKYVKKSDLNRAKALAKRDYENKLLPVLLSLNQKLNDLQETYTENVPENVYSDMCEGRRHLVVPYFPEKEKYIEQWISQEYEHWEISDQSKGIIYTRKGERVRSKSEKIIADELSRFHVPYRYEYPLEVSSGNAKKVIRPDFIALNKRTLKEYIIEHLGMMDKAEYYNRTMEKLDLYEKNGYLIGRDLILLHETAEAPLNMQTLDKYIKTFLL